MRTSVLLIFILLFVSYAYANNMNRPQTPLPPYDYDTLNITITNPSDGTILNGTITKPKGGKSKASVVLATGSGAQNRDEELFGHKPFKVIADFLTKNGYTILRMDDRTFTYPNPQTHATTDTFLTDIYAGIEFLKRENPDTKIGILGHSEGGSIAIKAGAKNLVDFIITLAAPAFRGDSLIISQVKAISKLNDNDPQWKNLYPTLRRRYNLVMSDIPTNSLYNTLYYDVISTIPSYMLTDQLKSQINAEINAMTSDWFREFLRYDPSEDIKNINIKWLALNGNKDLQVPSPSNPDRIKELNSDVTVITFDNLNHLFQNAISGGVEEYPNIEETISYEVLKTILEWLDNNI